MRRFFTSALCMSICLLGGAALRSQETFSLTAGLKSDAIPNLDTALVIEGEKGQSFDFTGAVTLTSTGVTGEEGPQGWSLGIRNDGVEIVSTTVDGTVSASTAKGGLVDGGFVVTELIDPAKKGNNGKKGMVQAVVLSFTLPVSLPPNSTQITAINAYKATVGDATVEALLKFEDGLIGKGQPVQNNITFKGATKIPTLGEKKITVRAKVVVPTSETGLCNNTLDDDQDGKADCADSDCTAEAFCKETGNCADGKDNDVDGQTDCRDTDCAADAACRPANEKGLCADGLDNDVDGQTDCADTDCSAEPACGTKGFDLILEAQGSKREGKKNVVEVDCGAGGALTMTVAIEKTQDPEANGAQGWSIAITHDSAKLDIQNSGGFPTIDGTDAGALFDGGFKKTEVVDPAKNGGKSGLVSAVVLSFTLPVTLDPAKKQSIALSKYSLKAGVTTLDPPTTIMFMDGLRGSGQPVQNILTVNGNSVTPTNLISLDVKCQAGPPPSGKFVRGNANDDGKVNIADPIWIINELVRKGPKTKCQDAADANDDGQMDLSDAMYLIQWRFLAGPAPSAPFGGIPAGCGTDPTADSLDCAAGSASSCP